MLLNQDDQEVLAKLCESDPDFASEFGELITWHAFRFPTLSLVAIAPLRRDIADGKPPRFLVGCRPGEAKEVTQAKGRDAIQEVQLRALGLAARFPEPRRWYWHVLFICLALGDSARFAQAQRGGAPRGRRPNTTEEYKDLAGWYHRTALSQREFCEQAGVSRQKLQRALRSARRR